MNFMSVLVWSSYFISLFFLVYWLLLFFEKRSEIRKDAQLRPRFKEYPFITIAVPAYNEEDTIVECVASLCKLDWPVDRREIMVVNDGSKDATSRLVREFIAQHPDAGVVLIEQKNQGKAAALNNALQRTKGKYFACLDADSFVEPQSLKHIIYRHERDPRLAIATPIMKVARPRHWVQKFQRLEYMAGMLMTKLMSYMQSNYVAPGPFSIYKTDIVREIGGFDTESLVEDQEIAYRAQVHHYRITQVPNAVVHTVAPNDLKGLQKQRNRWMKGSVHNLIKYRRLMFNREYGDFGMFQMPLNVASFALAFIAIGAFVYYVLRPVAMRLHDLWLIDFDLIPYLQSLTWRFDFLQLRVTPMFILYLLLTLGVLFLFLSSRVNNDRVRRYGTLYIIPYFFVFYLILSFVAIRVLVEVALGKKQKW